MVVIRKFGGDQGKILPKAYDAYDCGNRKHSESIWHNNTENPCVPSIRYLLVLL